MICHPEIKLNWTVLLSLPPSDHPGADLVPHHRGNQLQRAEEDPRQVSPGDFWEPGQAGV